MPQYWASQRCQVDPAVSRSRHHVEVLAAGEELVALSELAHDLIRRVPPALVRSHVAVVLPARTSGIKRRVTTGPIQRAHLKPNVRRTNVTGCASQEPQMPMAPDVVTKSGSATMAAQISILLPEAAQLAGTAVHGRNTTASTFDSRLSPSERTAQWKRNARHSPEALGVDMRWVATVSEEVLWATGTARF